MELKYIMIEGKCFSSIWTHTFFSAITATEIDYQIKMNI